MFGAEEIISMYKITVLSSSDFFSNCIFSPLPAPFPSFLCLPLSNPLGFMEKKTVSLNAYS